MKKRKLLFDKIRFELTLTRLCAQLIEHHGHFEQSVLIGLQPRGALLALCIEKAIARTLSSPAPPMGTLDSTFHKDNYDKKILKAYETHIPFSVDKKRVILIDDVLYSGRTVRAAMDALLAYGQPAQTELLVLIDRVKARDVPIQANYVGRKVNTSAAQYVQLELEKKSIWLVEKEKNL